LFTVLAAINAAGYDADLSSTANSSTRREVRDSIAARHPKSLEPIKRFFAAHRQKDWNAELNQYISFALTLGGPPDFQFQLKPNELPPDAAALTGFETLLPEFYQDANIENLWNRSRTAYDQAIQTYHGPVSAALLQANGYLRNPTSGYLGRRFQIFIDLLGAPNQIQSRSYKDDYYVVVTPAAEPQVDEIRHAYLHYVLDPLALKFSKPLERIRGMAVYAQGAPALPDAYRNDYILLSTECLIKAVESRVAAPAERQHLVDEAFREGFVMTPAFADGLLTYEKQPAALRLYFPDLAAAVDLKREEKRLESAEFAAQPAVKKVRRADPPPEPELSAAEKSLEEADDLYRKRELDRARQAFLKVLQQTTLTPLHAKAYYGLARVAALEKDPDLAEKLFQKVLESSPDDETKSWAYLYLGRLADSADRRDEAVNNYRNVLSIGGAAPAAKTAAEKGLHQSFSREK
jgi:TolA-binding protein